MTAHLDHKVVLHMVVSIAVQPPRHSHQLPHSHSQTAAIVSSQFRGNCDSCTVSLPILSMKSSMRYTVTMSASPCAAKRRRTPNDQIVKPGVRESPGDRAVADVVHTSTPAATSDWPLPNWAERANSREQCENLSISSTHLHGFRTPIASWSRSALRPCSGAALCVRGACQIEAISSRSRGLLEYGAKQGRGDKKVFRGSRMQPILHVYTAVSCIDLDPWSN